MSVFINFKICDNASECSGIEVCSTNALCWDEKKHTVIIDNDKCITCGKCVGACPAGAICVAHNKEEELQIQEDFDNDPRTLQDLMVERYGASPIDKSIIISVFEAEKIISKESVTIAIEIINPDDTACLINSVPISEVFGSKNYKYYKILISDKDYNLFATKYAIVTNPTLLIFKKSVLLQKIDGSVENNNIYQRDEFISKVISAIE